MAERKGLARQRVVDSRCTTRDDAAAAPDCPPLDESLDCTGAWGDASRDRSVRVVLFRFAIGLSCACVGVFTTTTARRCFHTHPIVSAVAAARRLAGRRRVAFVATRGGITEIWVREFDSLVPRSIPGTEEAAYPFWLPDGRSIGFFTPGFLKRIDLQGGPARVLATVPDGRGGAWNTDGTILFSPHTQAGLSRVPASGGEVTPVTRLDSAAHQVSHRWPQFLADSRHFIYFVQSTAPTHQGIYLGALGTETAILLTTSELSAAVASDHLLYVLDDALVARQLDTEKGQLLGEPVPVVERVSGSSSFYAAFSVAQTGLIAYSSSSDISELVWFERNGRRGNTIGAPAEYVDFRLSPDARQLAVAEVDPRRPRPDIRVMDLVRGAKQRLTAHNATDASPVWSRDGTRMVFRSNRRGAHDLFLRASQAVGEDSLLIESAVGKYPTDWTPDGKAIIYHSSAAGTGSDIWLLPVGGGSPVPLVQTPFTELHGHMSPDSRWIAYSSLETGAPEVYLRSVGTPALRWQVSTSGGSDPRWRRDGRELFFLSTDGWLMSVPVGSSDSPVSSAPQRLLQTPAANIGVGSPSLYSNYDVTADGKRFVVKIPVSDPGSQAIHVFSDWTRSEGRRQFH